MYQCFCTHCGTRLMPQARFCHGCAAAVNLTPAPVAAPVSQPLKPAAVTREKPKSRGRKYSAGVLFLTLIFIFSLLITLSLGQLRLLTQTPLAGEVLGAVLQQVDLTQIPTGEENADRSAAALLAEQIQTLLPTEITVTEEAVQQYWSRSGLIPFLTDTVNQSVSDLRTGDVTAPLTAADVEALLLADQPLMEELTGASFTQEDLSILADGVMALGILDYFQTASLKNAAPEVFSFLNQLLSDEMLIALTVMMALAAVGMLLLRRLRLFYAMEDVSIPLMAAGGWFSGHLLALSAAALAVTYFLGSGNLPGLANLAGRMLILPLSVLAVGIVTGVIGYLGDRFQRQ